QPFRGNQLRHSDQHAAEPVCGSQLQRRLLRFVSGIRKIQPGDGAVGKPVSSRFDSGEHRDVREPEAAGENFLSSEEKPLAFASIAEIGRMFRKQKLSPVELTRAMLARIEKLQPRLNAFITICGEQALETAKRSEKELLSKNKKSRK